MIRPSFLKDEKKSLTKNEGILEGSSTLIIQIVHNLTACANSDANPLRTIANSTLLWLRMSDRMEIFASESP